MDRLPAPAQPSMISALSMVLAAASTPPLAVFAWSHSARGQVHHVADHRVLEAFGRADETGQHATARHADASAEHTLGAGQFPWECGCGSQRAIGMIRLVLWGAEQAEGRVALELVDPTALSVDHRHDDPEEAIQHRNDLFRRVVLGVARIATQVDEQHGDIAAFADRRALSVQGKLCQTCLADLAVEQLSQRLAFADPGRQVVHALGQTAELTQVVDGNVHVELAALHLAHGVADPPQRACHGAGGDSHDQATGDEADCCDPGEAPAVEGVGADHRAQAHRHQGDPATQQPRQHQAGQDVASVLGEFGVDERQCIDGAEVTLEEQIEQGAGDDPCERDSGADPLCVGVDETEDHRCHEP